MRRLGLAAAALLVAAAPVSAAHAGGFESKSIPVRSLLLDDLGVVDYDRDGDLDIFTTNHLERQSLLRNDGAGRFTETLSALGLDQTPVFPGWEDHPHAPDTSAPGLYVYRTDGIVLEYVAPAPGPISGSVELLSEVRVANPDGATVSVSSNTAAQPPRTTVEFSAGASFRIVVRPDQLALPIALAVDAPFPVAQVFVGESRIQPPGLRFTLSLRDRHGIAWADLNGDLRTDAFVVRGGVSGAIAQFNGLVQDELLLRDGNKFINAKPGSGIDKGGCRGRIAAALDVNRDGLLDLFTSCFQSTPKLYRALPGGGYVNESAALAAVRTEGSDYAWLDVNLDGALELLVAKKRRFAVIRRRSNGQWVKRQGLRSSHRGSVRSMAVADYDRDGDPDVFVGTTQRNVVLRNSNGELRQRNPKRFGLPRSGSPAVAWTDYDNDGLLDLHALPQGLFRARSGRPPSFHRTGRAATRRDIALGVAQWFDVEGDGDRDALITTHRADEKIWPVELLVNRRDSARWLQVELVGRPGNVEAIGARVQMRARKGGPVQTAWVGENDTSRLSRGHYRLYFGLGEDKGRVRSVVVSWPDGGRTRLSRVRSDRLLRIERP